MSEPKKKHMLSHAEVFKVYTHLVTHKDRFGKVVVADVLKEFEEILGRPVDPKNVRDWAANAGVEFKVTRTSKSDHPGGVWYDRQKAADAKIELLEHRVRDIGAALADAVSRLRKLESDLGVNLLKSAL